MNLAIAALLTASVAALPEIANPGFEKLDQQTGLPAEWLYTSLPGQARLVRYSVTTLGTENGGKVLSIAVSPDHPDRHAGYNAHQDLANFVVGKTYRVSAKVRTSSLHTLPIISLQCWDADRKQMLAIANSPDRELDADVTEWETIQTSITVHDETSILKLRIGFQANGNAGGNALIDDVEITEVE